MTAALSHARRALVALLVACAALAAAAPARAVTIGYAGASYGTLADAPTASKPESKLWFNAGSWWASMLDTVSGGHHIFRLDRSTHQWIDTGVALDPRPGSHADVLWDAVAQKLYVVSNLYDESPITTSTNPARLWRFSYDGLNNTYTRDTGFPVAINTNTAEAVTLAKDSTGKLWATWVFGRQVKVAHTTSDDATWSAPYVLPVAGVDVTTDDISTIVAFGAGKVGVMWSNQVDSQFHFAVHADGGGDDAASWSATAIPNPTPTALADDHISLKADSAGRVYAAVKHTTMTAGDPNVSLLVRSAGGTFAWHTVTSYPEQGTRPIVVLDEQHAKVAFYLTNSTAGGRINEKVSSMSSIAFAGGPGTSVIRDDTTSQAINNVTSTKQSVDSASGIVLLASDDSTRNYWHGERAASATSSPEAWFSAFPTQPTTGQTVTLTSRSVDPDGDIATQSWDLNGDGIYDDQTGASATTSFTVPGPHTVRLRVTDSGGRSDTFARTINVLGQPPVASFDSSPSAPLTGQTITLTSTSTDPDNDITATDWDLDGDGVFGEATDASGPSATVSYPVAGTYTVGLRVTDASKLTSTATKTITVTAPAPAVTTLTFAPTADAYVKSSSATSKYGTASTLRVRKDTKSGATNYRSYLRFVVSGITGQVTGVKLRLNVTDASKNGGDVFLLPATSNGWLEKSITWKTAPALPATPRIGTAGVVAKGVAEIDLGTAITANGTYTLALAGGSTDSAYYASREASAAPKLIVTQRG